MANNNIEQYLEAMLAALDGDTVPDVPPPSWNIEKYLAAILTKLSSGGGSGGGSSGGGVLVVHNVDNTLDKTWQEIYDADIAIMHDIVVESDRLVKSVGVATGISHLLGKYNVQFTFVDEGNTWILNYSADTASDHPVINLG